MTPTAAPTVSRTASPPASVLPPVSPPDPGRRARDVRLIGLVAGAHFMSHFFQLSLPPLFPLLKEALGVPYLALGVLLTVFYTASGVGQALAGFVVDRVGARPVLLSGLCLLASAIALAGLAPGYAALVPILALAGVGNSVFHPADYSILNARVSPRWLGRAYSAHSVAGNLGWVAAPAVVIPLSALIGWRGALATVGIGGLVVAALLATRRELGSATAEAPAAASARVFTWSREASVLLAPPIVMAFAYFTLLSGALSAVQTFSVSTLVSLFGAPLGVASHALTAFLLGNCAGILVGGVLADRVTRHHLVAGGGLWAAAASVLLLASGTPTLPWLAPVMAAAGFAMGITQPSRDTLVRSVTPRGASGKVFGFVYSGLDAGSLLLPPLYGWLIDRSEPRGVFLVATGLLLMTSLTVFEVRRRAILAPVRT
jgi:MFS transporter, FSR family, fosmidomycin resistance protein